MNERDAMLDYEWGNQSATVMFSGDETAAAQNHRQFFDPYGGQQPGFDHAGAAGGSLVGPSDHFAGPDRLQLFHHPGGEQAAQENSAHLCSLYDPRAYGGAAAFQHASQVPLLSLETAGPAGFVVVPKSEPLGGGGGGVDFSGASLGLNLGGRTYFSSAEDDFVNRLYRRSRAVDAGSFNTPRCQAEGCNADLTHAKHYHRRHKVCEFHSKAATVIAGGLTQRFCQQCSRFHVLSEFDNGKRSCRRRLADHNRRRRKNPQQPNRETGFNNTHLLDNAQNSSSDSLARSPSDSGAHSSPSVTVAVSPPRMSIDCFGQRSYGYLSNAAAAAGSSAASASSLFFSHG